MKFFTSALAVVTATAAFASADKVASLRGEKKTVVEGQHQNNDRKLLVPPGGPLITQTPINEGDTFAPFSAPLPETGPTCTVLPRTGIFEEFVVVQYNNTLYNGTKISELDFTNRTLTFQLDVTYVYAWSLAKGDCAQDGAVRELYDSEVLAHNPTDATFLLRLGSYSNSAVDSPFTDLPMNDDCGDRVYNATAGTVPVDFDVDVNDERRHRKLQEEECDCKAPLAFQVLEQFNEALVIAFDNDGYANWTMATQQLCVIPDCTPPEGVLATYNATGVCLSELSSLSAWPSSMPSEFPTSTDNPTSTDVPTGTDVPTSTDVPTGTDSPTGKPSEETDAPSEETGAPSEGTTKTPTAAPTKTTESPSEDAVPTETTDSPSEDAVPTETTDSPVETDEPVETGAPTTATNSTDGRYLVWDGEEMMVEEVVGDKKHVAMKQVGVNQAPFAYDNEHKICQQVDAKLVDNAANRKLCKNYLDLPYVKTPEEKCKAEMHKIPKTYFSVSKSNEQSYEQVGITMSNPSYERKHYGDDEAYEFVKEHCGSDAAAAYQCLAPPAYRADLFRFCALYVEGGLYLDSDIIPLVPLEELYDPCSVATVGHDWPQGKPQKQMKILAGQPGAPIFQCMLHKIITNVRTRSYPENPLALTGPMALHECFAENYEHVSVTYHDTRDASYPYTGMRAGNMLLAFESPGANIDRESYQIDFNKHEVYRPTCPLHKNKAKPAKVSSE